MDEKYKARDIKTNRRKCYGGKDSGIREETEQGKGLERQGEEAFKAKTIVPGERKKCSCLGGTSITISRRKKLMRNREERGSEDNMCRKGLEEGGKNYGCKYMRVQQSLLGRLSRKRRMGKDQKINIWGISFERCDGREGNRYHRQY